ncbi:GNAT family N-acetyltransferase [Paenibacillus beijingensis]|uniref:Acetyltransferase n=1 Tax=Paenibacillus beijingensis TaxID=1126833 RepID=A0A0D5NHW8_9BACL|nr:GNAT family N-acetyltransferase [Paenibacillus beijingensis]AJY74979.1 acetyltransferase [Paenibacillus beijingensis]
MPQFTARPQNDWKVVPMTERHGEEICGWRYEPPYDLYGWDSWKTICRLEIEFGDPELRSRQYASVTDDRGELKGFAQFFPMEGVIRLGLGMRPDLCGRGFGPYFVSIIVQEAARRAPDAEIDLEVLSWNRRAVRAYEKAGFRLTDTYSKRTPSGPAQFHCMVFEPDTPL